MSAISSADLKEVIDEMKMFEKGLRNMPTNIENKKDSQIILNEFELNKAKKLNINYLKELPLDFNQLNEGTYIYNNKEIYIYQSEGGCMGHGMGNAKYKNFRLKNAYNAELQIGLDYGLSEEKLAEVNQSLTAYFNDK